VGLSIAGHLHGICVEKGDQPRSRRSTRSGHGKAEPNQPIKGIIMKPTVALAAAIALAASFSSAIAAPSMPTSEDEAQATIIAQRVTIQGHGSAIESETIFARESQWSDQRPVTLRSKEAQVSFTPEARWSEQRPITAGVQESESIFANEARWSDQRPVG
jgi:hypothetical protein